MRTPMIPNEKKSEKNDNEQKDNEQADEEDESIPDKLVGMVAPFHSQIRTGVFVFSAVVSVLYFLMYLYSLYTGGDSSDSGTDTTPTE